MPDQQSLDLQNISAGYGAVILFQDLNLKLYSGEFVCFMGPNGVGKSTLLKTIAGLHLALSGQIAISNKVPTAAQISVVLTDRISIQNMTVFDLICMGRYPYLGWNIRLTDDDQKIIEQAIHSVQLEEIRDKKISELSDGQMQMTMIARALAQDTPFMLLDEPTAHLDLNNRLEIMRLLRSIARHSGKGIIASTHDLDLALQTADQIWLAGNNKEIVTGMPEDLVLNDAFDSIFQFKGFDLKTGKVQHTHIHSKSIRISGEGYVFLWTKNALERNGYIVDENGALLINIQTDDNQLSWRINNHTFNSLSALIQSLQSFAI